MWHVLLELTEEREYERDYNLDFPFLKEEVRETRYILSSKLHTHTYTHTYYNNNNNNIDKK